MMRLLVPALAILSCTGRKLPLPPEPSGTVITDSTYIRTSYWEFEDRIMDFQVGPDGLMYVLFKDSLVRFYASFKPEGLVIRTLNARSFYITQNDRAIYILADSSAYLYRYDGSFSKRAIVGNEADFISAKDSLIFFVSFKDMSRLVKYHIDSPRALDTLAYKGNGILNVNEPHGLFYRDGVIYVASSANHWVEGLTESTPVQNILHLGGVYNSPSDSSGRFNYPVDVCLDMYGGIYVLELGNKRFQKFSPTGEFVMVSSSPDTTLVPVAIGVSPNGEDLYVAYEFRIEKYNKPQRIGEGDQ